MRDGVIQAFIQGAVLTVQSLSARLSPAGGRDEGDVSVKHETSFCLGCGGEDEFSLGHFDFEVPWDL